jgi:ABC-type multidrug transport system fused ATPase/permease subunit
MYQTILEDHLLSIKTFEKKANRIGMLRLIAILIALGSVAYHFKFGSSYLPVVAAVCVVLFLVLIKVHDRIKKQRQLFQVLRDINLEEIKIQQRDFNWRDGGDDFADAHHLYAHDLDIFGKNSLFQYIQRTATPGGRRSMAALLKNEVTAFDITEQQEAIKELAPALDWRQKFYARARIAEDLRRLEMELIKWCKSDSNDIPKLTTLMAFVGPILFIASLAVFISTKSTLWFKITIFIFFSNISALVSIVKRIKSELGALERVEVVLQQLSEMAALYENLNVSSKKLTEIKSILQYNQSKASEEINRLGRLFNSMSSIQNLIGAAIFNGTALYHVHTFRALLKWKKNHTEAMQNWINSLGELESISSLAQFAFDNPNFAFPEITNDGSFYFEALGHPLIAGHKRIDNSIDLSKNPFVLLTGSNMSGKSTFLRTLGVNMALANCGSVVCAKNAKLQPLKILASMRLSDSLADDASYFFAEVERLSQIFDQIEKTKSFVLLDEILRGTNSDDKRNGTIAIIRKLILKKATGVLATHDLEVCQLTNEFTDYLSNKCFEVEILNNDLAFDYKLRDGICKNKSATFLMQKKGVI